MFSNYSAAGVAAAGASTAVESTAGASTGASTAGVSSTGASTALSLQDTTVNAAITAKLKNTFFILVNYKRLIINSKQIYKNFDI
jgi:hypothetical protein